MTIVVIEELERIEGEAIGTKETANTLGMKEVKAQVFTAYVTYKTQDELLKELRKNQDESIKELRKQANYTKWLAFVTTILAIATVILAIVTYLK